MRRIGAVALALSLALGAGGAARAGGAFERVVGVGADGRWQATRRTRPGRGSDGSLFAGGARVPVPPSGYVRLFPLIGGLPGIPGRYYPGRALCFAWHDSRGVDCRRVSPAAARLLRPLATLPRWRLRPTVVVEVRHARRVLRYADGNVFAALELALERPAVCCAQAPRRAVPLTVRWRGPRAALRPRTLLLGPRGVYSGGRLYPLRRDVW